MRPRPRATIKENKSKDSDGQGSPLVADVSNQQQVASLFSALDSIDILVNTRHGIFLHVGTVETTTEEDFDRLYKVNVKGVYNCLRAAIPVMKKNKGGVILNMSSVAASAGLPGPLRLFS